MVMTTSKPAAARLADMTREEAKTVTEQIKQNFDSLGNMLVAARERKAYRVLGYRSFESYCKTEFGKSSSAAYQVIEDTKIRAQLEAHISENYGEEVTLKFPSSHLRPLKAVEGLDNKLKVIEYAQKLAKSEGKKATKKHLEVAVFEISGKRSEDFRGAIRKLGFTQGVQVETISPIKRERGIVTKVDKLGKIHVELYYGSNKANDYDATQLRILTNEEKPANPLEGSIASKDDRVLIYAEGLQGKKGTIYSWKEGKTALVKIDGRDNDSPIDIAYAEMERIRESEPKNASWDSDLVWDSGRNTYYYWQKENRIKSNRWPTGLKLEPYTHSDDPIEFIKDWESRFARNVLESLATPDRTKTLVLTQARNLPEEEGKEFAADLIAGLLQLFPEATPEPIAHKALGISFSQTVDELKSGQKRQTRRAWQDDYAKSFIRYFEEGIAIPALDKGRHRGGQELGFIKLTQRPYQQYLSEMSATDLQQEGGMVATTQEFIDTFFKGQDKLVWVLHFELLSTPTNKNTEEVTAENHLLRERLAEAETVIQQMVAASMLPPLDSIEVTENNSESSTPGEAAPGNDFSLENNSETSTPGEAAPGNDFSLENNSETSTPGDTAPQPDTWKELLANNGFTPVPYELEGFFKSHWRGWNIFFHSPNGGVTAIDIANKKEEMFSRCTEIDFDIDLGDEESIVNWTRKIINQVEDFCPGQLSLNLIQSNQNPTSEIPADSEILAAKRERIEKDLETLVEELFVAKSRKKVKKIRADIENLNNQLKDVEDFAAFRVGDSVIRNIFPDKKGIVDKLKISTTGMLTAWVTWPKEYEGEPNSPEEHHIGTLTNLSSVDGSEK